MFNLDIGPGTNWLTPAADWYTVDVVSHGLGYRPAPKSMDYQGWSGMDRIGEWGSREGLPFPANSFRLIHASHCLEHIQWDRTQEALKQAHALLIPGGRIELHVPDFSYIVQCYQNKELIGDWPPNLGPNEYMKSVAARTYALGKRPGDWHKALFDADYLRQCLTDAGFINVESPIPYRGHNFGPFNLAMGAYKRV